MLKKYQRIFIAFSSLILMIIVSYNFVLLIQNEKENFDHGNEGKQLLFVKYGNINCEKNIKKSLEFVSNNDTSNGIFFSKNIHNLFECTVNTKQTIWMPYNIFRIMEKYGFNVQYNALIPNNRHVPDDRHVNCLYWHYDPNRLPTVSIIIPVHQENKILLKRTIQSILLNTPRFLLLQIIIVVDQESSSYENFDQSFKINEHLKENEEKSKKYKNYLQYFPLFFGEQSNKIIIHQNLARIGWSRSINNVLNITTGEVLIFLKSHIEVGHNWLPPLLAPIVLNPQSISIPTLGQIKPDDFMFEQISLMGLSWNLGLYIKQNYLNNINIEKFHKMDLIYSPQFAITRKFLDQIDLFNSDVPVPQDNEHIIWDYTIKVKKCGGKIFYTPCSVIYVLKKSISDPFGHVIDETHVKHGYKYDSKCILKQTAQIILDKKSLDYFYVYHPLLRNFTCNELFPNVFQKCSSKNSLMKLSDNDFVPIKEEINTFISIKPHWNKYFGQLKNSEYFICLNVNDKQTIDGYYCFDKPTTKSSRLDINGYLFFEEYCINANLFSLKIYANDCSFYIDPRFNHWEYKDGKLITWSILCLAYLPNKGFLLETCSNHSNQQWTWL